MRVALAQQSPWDTLPTCDSCGTVRWIDDTPVLPVLPVLPRLPGLLLCRCDLLPAGIRSPQPCCRWKRPGPRGPGPSGSNSGRDQAFFFSSAAFSASARAFSSAAWIRSSSSGCSSSISFSESIPSYQAVFIG